jgi:hypothetical protein
MARTGIGVILSFRTRYINQKFETKMKIVKVDNMNIIIERLKELYFIFLAALISAFSPVRNALILLMLAIVFNVLIGIIEDIHVNKAPFNLKKAFNAVTQLLFYTACVVFVDYAGRLMGDPDVGLTAVKWLTYIVVYFYLTNIFRNAKLIYPRSAAIRFIYDLLSTEIFSRLKNMIGFNNNKNYNDDNQ